MPKAWSEKDERQYEKVKQSAKDSGKSTDRAEQIAARTVNKRRRVEGRTFVQFTPAHWGRDRRAVTRAQ
jgi:hypothetical protein